MRKLKLLFTGLALMGGMLTASADDVYKDVTSNYLTNANFEGEYTVYSNPSNDRAIYQPTGWTVTYSSGDPYDLTALNSECLQWSNFSGKAQLTDGGDNTYWVRMRWGTGAVLELSQSVTLPEGSYKLTAAYYKNGSGGDGYILVNSTEMNTSVNEDVWKSLTIDFTSDGITATKIGCKAKHTNTYEKFLAFDNFVLEWNLTEALTTLIANATEVYNEDTSNTTLKSAIDAADAVKDSQDATELETAYNNLKSVAALALNRKAWKEAKAAAEAVLANAEYTIVVGKEKADLEAEIAKAEPSTVDAYNEAAEALATATAAFISAKTNYDVLAREIVKATALGIDASSYAATLSSTAVSVLESTKDLKVAEYNYVTTNYAYGVELGTWTTEGPTGSLYSQHWSGTSHEYLEQSTTAWGQNAWTIKYDQNLTLPAGSYVFKVAGRQANSDGVTLELVVKNGETELGSVSDFPKGDTGLGINTSGATDYSTESTYVNNNAGHGWEWRYVKFTLDELTTVNVAVNAVATTEHMWVSFCDATVQATSAEVAELLEALTTYNTALTAAKTAKEDVTYTNVTGSELIALQAAINADATLDKSTLSTVQDATTTLTNATNAFTEAVTAYDALVVAKASAKLEKVSGNIGTAVFQYNETTNNNLYSAYESGYNTMQNTAINSSTTAAMIQIALGQYQELVDNYINQELNAPADGSRYFVKVATADHAKEGNAMTVVLGKLGANNPTGYSINANSAANANLSQAFIFTKVSGNFYNISIERTEGTVYLTYGSLNGSEASWNKSQIQATTNEEAKGLFKIVATETDNVFNIYNTEADANIDCENGGSIYTNTDITNEAFTVAEASQASVIVNIAADVQYATRIFPFTPTLPTGIVAYSCETTENDVLTLEVVEAPAANVPYILFAESGFSGDGLIGWGCGEAENYTVGLLTGVYAATPAPAGSYVLQNNDNKVGFYQVNEGEDQQPTVGANRCYLTDPEPEAARPAYFFFDNETTGIAAVNVLTSGEAEIFNASGVRVPGLQKGMNIVRKADGTSYKVVVK